MDIPFAVVIIIGIIAAIALKNAGVSRTKSSDGLAGICSGIAEHYDLSVAGVRVLWVIWSLFLGGGVITYIVLWCILPQRK